MGAEVPMLRARQRGHRICRHPQCGPDEERPRRERRDERLRCTCTDDPWDTCDLHDACEVVKLVPVDESEDDGW